MPRIRQLCSEFEITSNPQHPLDNLAVDLFDTKRYDVYHQSARPIDERWGIPMDRRLLKHTNPDVEGFQELGPNEKYVTNKILSAPSGSLLLVVGDLGVGKTGFSNFLMNSILTKLIHRNIEKTAHCPLPIYLDFMLDGGNFTLNDFRAVRDEFAQRFCDKLASRIARLVPLRDELTTVWDAILTESAVGGALRSSNTAFDYIQNRTNLEEAEPGAANADASYKKRLEIRKEIDARGYRLHYLAGLLQYVRQTFFRGHETCLLILVDNIDPEPAVVQHAAKLILKQFTRLSKVRVIATARHTSYHQQFSDRGAEALDAAPFCGLDPLDVVNLRIQELLEDGARYKKNVNPEAWDLVRTGLIRLKNEALSHEAFKSLFTCLAGHSVRRGLLLAQHLVHNSEYDLAAIGVRNPTPIPLHISTVLRALMVGPSGVYSWSRDGLIENIFDVQAQRGVSHLIKLRILKAVSAAGTDGLSINALNGLMSGFRYPTSLMCAAINEMMEDPKGLIWCDQVLEFDDFTQMISRHSHARLHVSPTGRGYESSLFRKLDYIQEVMLDTEVDQHRPTPFGSGWDYGRLQDRFSVIYEFIHRLFIEDRLDMQAFVEINDPREFRARLGGYGLVSKVIAEGIRETARRILDAAVKQQELRSGTAELAEWRDSYLGKYDDIVKQAEEFERQSL